MNHCSAAAAYGNILMACIMLLPGAFLLAVPIHHGTK